MGTKSLRGLGPRLLGSGCRFRESRAAAAALSSHRTSDDPARARIGPRRVSNNEAISALHVGGPMMLLRAALQPDDETGSWREG